MRWQSLLAVVGVVAFAALLAACGGGGDSTGGATEADTGTSTESEGSTYGTGLELGKTIESHKAAASVEPWFVWNADSCEFEETDEHPAAYTGELREVTGGDSQLGYMHYGNRDPFGTANSKSVEASADKAEMPLNVYNLKFPSKTEPLAQAKNAITQGDQAVAQANLDVSTLPAFFEVLQAEGCIPSVQLYIPIDEHPAMGANWPDVGRVIGEYVGEEAQKRGWDPEETALVACVDPAHGPTVNIMFDEIPKALEKGGFPIPEDNQFELVCKEEVTQAGFIAATDWLTSHQDFKHVAMVDNDAVTGVPMSRALEQSQDRPDEDTIVAAGADDETAHAALRNGEYDVSIDFQPELYGPFLVSMMQDILAGNPVPSFVGTELPLLTRENIDERYPNE